MKRFAVFCLVVSLFLEGCASYRGGLLPSKDVMNYEKKQVQKEVYVVADFLDTKETKQIFQFDLQSRGIQPVFIIMDNRSLVTYDFKKSDLNKQVMSSQEVADKCKFNTAGRATAYGVAGIFIWPFLIPAVVDGVGSSEANRKIEDDYAFKELQDGRLTPNALMNGIVFVPKMKEGEDFTIRLKDMETFEILRFSFQK
ncbi:MAG: hypothetical protein WC324_05305 [Candidatus Omnitrophota bacterium]|jgi:hypothetical protein